MSKQKAKDKPKTLNQREMDFCIYYLQGDSAKEAAIKAKFSEKYASRRAHELPQKPHISAYIESQRAKVERKTLITLDWKMEKLKAVVISIIPDGAEGNVLLPSDQANTLIKAIAEMNKVQGHYSPEKLVTANVNIDVDIQKARETLNEIIQKHEREY